MNSPQDPVAPAGPLDSVFERLLACLDAPVSAGSYLLFGGDLAAFRALVERLSAHCLSRDCKLKWLRPVTAETALDAVLRAAVPGDDALSSDGWTAPLWIELGGAADDDAWPERLEQLLCALDGHHDTLAACCARPLIFHLPLPEGAAIDHWAPALWRARSHLALMPCLRDSRALPAQLKALRELAIRLAETGQALQEDEDPEGGATLEALSDAVAVFRLLRDGTAGTQQALRDLAIALHDLGEAQRSVGTLDPALASFRESLSLFRTLRDLPGGSARPVFELTIALGAIGESEREAGRPEAALAAWHEYLDLLEQRRAQGDDSDMLLRDLAIGRTRAGDAQRACGQQAEAVASYSTAHALFAELCGRPDATAQSYRDLALCLNGLGEAQLASGALPLARASFDESLQLGHRLVETGGDAPRALRDLSVALNRLGELDLREGQVDAAVEAFSESVRLRRQIRERLGDSPRVLRDLAVALDRLGDALSDAEDVTSARAAYLECLSLRRLLPPRPDRDAERREAVQSLEARLEDVEAVIEHQGGH
ncbi:MAG: hypothetical protein KDG55_20335 [Rhodocyclaceae bacterium]|nr:hypothetical protein [Rhodocyclaceae bacterium]